MFLLLSVFACQFMDQPGHAFAPVKIAELEPEEVAPIETPEPKSDPLFEDPQQEVITMGVEAPPAEVEVTPDLPPPEIQEPQDDSTEEVLAVAPPTEVSEPVDGLRKATVKDGWRPTLIGVMMEGPTPRAVLAMPSGEETVVKAGDMISDEGVIVMSIGSTYVELAIIQSAEGRANIENLTLRPQFE